ncbi:MAG: type II toxin-antitoxin system VapC family toxin [Candidatus Omnitrophota bacterium]|nr:type II toxin-antitoxin system VapC family toxin [Candidatus Omnitrophota bacterium]
MKIPKFYFDTSIFNFALADDVPTEREITLRLLEEVRGGKYEVFISEVVLREINRAPQEKAVKLRDCIKKINPEELILDENTLSLAKEYIDKGVIPPKYEDDALHIAVASVNNLDAIVSWNFTHIVKLKTKREVSGINTLMGYKPIEICSPQEVIENA